MNKYVGIELLRGLSAVWVMLFHYRQVYPDTSYSYGILDPIISKGGLGVEVFFVLSGFIMQIRYKATFSSGFNRRDYAHYLIKRLARIWPLHALCTIAMVIGAYSTYFFFSTEIEDTRFNFVNIFSSLLLASFYFESTVDINMPAWTLSAEMFAYALLPIVFYTTKFKIGKYVAWSLATILAIYLSQFEFSAGFRLLCGYAAGIFFAEYIHKSDLEYALLYLAIATFLIYFIFGSYISLLLFFGCIITILCMVDSSLSMSSLACFLALWLGKLSFPAYIVHWPVRTYLRTAVEITGAKIPDSVMIFSYTIISFFCAYILHILVEEPARKYLTTRFTN
ncbi:acyltransferase [Hydrogenophaga aromaticivorans]|uniref:acyltransferase family protein n=1 Tax=Hydrogenophaga aromaticivorans TaxID=2610898 RepID=UPI001B384B39|nr:acyltransferase [Hydrogenophaga aromaticivorans]MBQ0921630.1 acyltransferase [Hydrogenophaga aromaticivorans]